MLYYEIILMVGVTFIISLITVGISKKISVHVGAIDKVNDDQAFRRMHKKALPRLGGLGMFLAFLAGYVLFGPVTTQMVSIIIGAFVLILVGMIDDINDVKQRYKFISHIIAACLVVFYGNLTIDYIHAFGQVFMFPSPINYLLPILFIIGAINAINLIDGLDGLSSGLTAIFFITISFIAITMSQFIGLDIIISLLMLGAVLGFLFHNFHPATIFAGDCGSQFMGYMIAVVALLGYKNVTFTSLIIPLLLLAVPILDTFLAIVRRLIKGGGINKGDKYHIHHQIMSMTNSTRKTVLIIYVIAGLFALASIIYTLGDSQIGFILYAILFVIVLWIAAITTIFRDKIGKNKKS